MAMRHTFAVVAIVLVALLAMPAAVEAREGGSCVACTLVVSLINQMALNQHLSIPQAAGRLCGYLAPNVPLVKTICDIAMGTLVPAVEKDYKNGRSPDFTCHETLKMCKGADKCALFKQWPPANSPKPVLSAGLHKIPNNAPAGLSHAQQMAWARDTIMGLVAESGIPEPQDFNELLVAMLGGKQTPLGDKHQPIFDADGDFHSTETGLRGSHWRGKDCDDQNANIYPGRKETTFHADVDHNCNGIYGVDPNGKPYEDKFCAATEQRGVITLGDSATAHFSIPSAWLHAATMNNDTFKNLLPVLEDEADWPQCSTWTAFEDPAKCPTATVQASSVYMALRQRNRCNHRDYQNLGVNGARTRNMAPPTGNIEQFTLGRKKDHPALVFYSLVGNDVCNGSPNFDRMTKPEDMERDVLAALDYLDERLPPNSYVVFLGLIDGRILFETMHNKEHPIGGTTYTNLYEYLICLEMTPCWGWLNPNATVRDLTYQRVQQLNAVYPKIIANHQYKNFKMHYIWTDMSAFIQKWTAAGHDPVELIELVDGFHPSTTGSYVIASEVVRILEEEFPEALGGVNPYNAEIEQVFGNQGGY